MDMTSAQKNGLKRECFTLIELLVVIAIIAVLAALLLPALSRAKAKAQEVICLSNNKQIVNAFLLYASDEDQWLPQCSVNNGGNPKDYGQTSGQWVLDTAYYMGFGWTNLNECITANTVYSCPTVTWKSPRPYLSGIAHNGYNGMGLQDRWRLEERGVRESSIDQFRRKKLADLVLPEETILAGDGRDSGTGSGGPGMQLGIMQRGLWWNGYFMKGNRHRGGMNIVWMDGHANWNDPFRIENAWYSPFK